MKTTSTKKTTSAMKMTSEMKTINKMEIYTTSHLTALAKLTPNQMSYQLFSPEIELGVMEETYAVRGIAHAQKSRHF